MPRRPGWRVALALVFSLTILAAPGYFGLRSLRAWRATYWLVVDVFGVHLRSGATSNPILTVRADQLVSVDLRSDPDGATVLLIDHATAGGCGTVEGKPASSGARS